MAPTPFVPTNANTYSDEIYNTTQAANSRDALGSSVKFTTPTVVNGKVYVATANGLAIFGEFATPASISGNLFNDANSKV